jgi:archaellum component FlaD/FlaE
VYKVIKELLDGLKSRLKGVGEKGGPLPPPGGIPPVPIPPMPSEQMPAPAPSMPPVPAAPSTEDFSALLGGGDTSELDNKVKALEEKTTKLESTLKETLDITKANKTRLDSIDLNMKKFLSLYELVTNQINPFVDGAPFKKEDDMIAQAAKKLAQEKPEEAEEAPVEVPVPEHPKPKPKAKPKEEAPKEEPEEEAPELEVPAPKPHLKLPDKMQDAAKGEPSDQEQVMFMQSVKDGTASFVMEWITSLVSEDGNVEKNTRLLKYLLDLGWITPKAYEALMRHMQALTQAGKAPQEQRIPLMVGMPSSMPRMQGPPQPPSADRSRPMPMPPMQLTSGSSPDQLMAVLEWVRYLVDKAGYEEASEILKYLVKLEWITPEAHTALLSYIQRSTPPGAIGLTQAKAPGSYAPGPQSKVTLSPNRIPSPTDFMRGEAPQYRVPIQPADQPPMQIPPQPMYREPQYREPQPQQEYQQPRREAPRRGDNAIIPLTELGSDIDSLAIILEWIRHLVDRAGTQGAKDIFAYYQTIGWLDQRVCQQLVKYVEGIKASEDEAIGYQPNIEDHATSLFFISKLKHMSLSEEDIHSMLGR